MERAVKATGSREDSDTSMHEFSGTLDKLGRTCIALRRYCCVLAGGAVTPTHCVLRVFFFFERRWWINYSDRASVWVCKKRDVGEAMERVLQLGHSPAAQPGF